MSAIVIILLVLQYRGLISVTRLRCLLGLNIGITFIISSGCVVIIIGIIEVIRIGVIIVGVVSVVGIGESWEGRLIGVLEERTGRR